MTARSFIPLLIGVLSSLVGFVTVSSLRQNRCDDAGGRWDAAARICAGDAGDAGALDVARASDVVAGVLVAIVLAFMLYRASTFAARHRSRGLPS